MVAMLSGKFSTWVDIFALTVVQLRMLKTHAIELLGGTVTSAADAIGVSYQAIVKWPAVLPPRIVDRVQAALYRKQLEETKPTTATQEVSHG